MTLAQVIRRHVTSYPGKGPNWFERGLIVLMAICLIAAVVAMLGCIEPEQQCATNCGGRGYQYNGITAWKPATCICGPAVTADGGAK